MKDATLLQMEKQVMRLIDANALQKYKVTGEIGNVSGDFIPGYAIGLVPTIEAEPVRYARCDYYEDDYTWWWVCSECGERVYIYPNYCPNCGAKMDLKE